MCTYRHTHIYTSPCFCHRGPPQTSPLPLGVPSGKTLRDPAPLWGSSLGCKPTSPEPHRHKVVIVSTGRTLMVPAGGLGPLLSGSASPFLSQGLTPKRELLAQTPSQGQLLGNPSCDMMGCWRWTPCRQAATRHQCGTKTHAPT